MIIPTTILLCLVPLLVQAQLVDDFSSPFAREGINTLRLWRGGDLVSGVSGGVSIAASGWWSEVIAPPTSCTDLTGKSLKFAYTSTAAGQRTVEFHMKAASCQGARATTAVARVNVVAGAGELTVPIGAFAGANPRLGFAFAFLGPMTVRRVEIVGGATPPPPADQRCVLSSASVGGCSADRLCPNGLCCSQYGWCGSTAAYCSTGCQSQCQLRPVLGLRSCDSPPPPPVPSTIPDPTANARDWVPSTALTNGRFERDGLGSYLSCGWPSAIALTYDDGPNPSLTPTILSALSTANIKTTFFWLGSLIRDNKALAQRAAAAGHHLASHSWSHPDLLTLSAADLNNEITWTETEIRSVVGLRPRYFRPPYGNINQGVYNRLSAGGYRVILWNFDTLDWAAATTEQGIVDQYRTQAVNPAGKSYITLQHDIQAKSAAVAGRVYAQVKANGFKPIPMYICLNELAYQN